MTNHEILHMPDASGGFLLYDERGNVTSSRTVTVGLPALCGNTVSTNTVSSAGPSFGRRTLTVLTVLSVTWQIGRSGLKLASPAPVFCGLTSGWPRQCKQGKAGQSVPGLRGS